MNLDRPDYYINRELSWLDFNFRVLEEAQDQSNPLLERVKFLAIVASNLDEFFEVRVAGLLQLREAEAGPTGPDQLTPAQQLQRIAEKAQILVATQYGCWNDELLPALADEGIRLWDCKDLTEEQLEFVNAYWRNELEPILTPIVVDPAHPFPQVINKALCIGALLESKHQRALGVVTVPRVLPRILQLPDTGTGGIHFVPLASIVDHHFRELFRGYQVISSCSFRATRNSDLYVNEEEADNLLEEIAEQLKNRRKGDMVRLEISSNAPDGLVNLVREQFHLDDEFVFKVNGPVNLNRVLTLYSDVARADLKLPPFTPVERNRATDQESFFAHIRRQDILLHHPYESFSTVIDFINMAAADAKVLAIKQTLYRTGENSPVVRALIAAAERGKEVTALVELKARFDEASNIVQARRLEESGVHVIYGVMGLKTHCKLAMLLRRDEDGLRRYAHLGTGNYNAATTRLYTDIGMITARPEITADVAEVFNLLTTRTRETKFRKLLVAPSTLMKGLIERIEREAEHANNGRPAAIVAKMNGLMDPKIIRSLYAASQAGVQIDLIVRGICCLRPGLAGVSENIRVYSIIGRYLEHSRVCYFANGGEIEVWAGSADWMNRNLRGRVEVVFPIEDEGLKKRVHDELLKLCLLDRVKSRLLSPDGTYVRLRPEEGQTALSVQDVLMQIAMGEEVDVDGMPANGDPVLTLEKNASART